MIKLDANNNNIPSDFGKEQLEFLSKIERYENRNEMSRFLLISSFGGILCLIAGILELVFYKFYKMDVVFFQYNLLNNPEPVLLFGVWVLTIFPLLIIVIFTWGTSGIINWNKTYRIIGKIAILLFLFSELTILILGEDNSNYIPIVWGMYIFIGFMIASYLMLKFEDQGNLSKYLFILGFIVLIWSLITYVFIDPEIAMFALLTGFGIAMTISGGLIYMLFLQGVKIDVPITD